MGNNNSGGKKRKPSKLPPSAKKKKRSNTVAWLVAAVGVLVVLIVFISLALIDQGKMPSQQEASSLTAIDGIKCESMEGSAMHEHAHLTILNNGQEVTVPANIGVYNAPGCLYWLHTHDTTGEIHMESPVKRSFTLGNFFDIWKQPLTQSQVLGFSDNGKQIQAYVDGKLYTGDPRNIELKPHAKVVLEVGPKFVPPPDTYTFPKGD